MRLPHCFGAILMGTATRKTDLSYNSNLFPRRPSSIAIMNFPGSSVKHSRCSSGGFLLTHWTWASIAYETLKRFLAIARREYELLALNQCSEVAWATNNKDSINSSFKMSKGQAKDLPAMAQQLLPVLNSLLSCATMLPPDRGNSLMLPTLALIAALRDEGIDVKPSEVFCGFATLNARENAEKLD